MRRQRIIAIQFYFDITLAWMGSKVEKTVAGNNAMQTPPAGPMVQEVFPGGEVYEFYPTPRG